MPNKNDPPSLGGASQKPTQKGAVWIRIEENGDGSMSVSSHTRLGLAMYLALFHHGQNTHCGQGGAVSMALGTRRSGRWGSSMWRVTPNRTGKVGAGHAGTANLGYESAAFGCPKSPAAVCWRSVTVCSLPAGESTSRLSLKHGVPLASREGTVGCESAFTQRLCGDVPLLSSEKPEAIPWAGTSTCIPGGTLLPGRGPCPLQMGL